LKEFETLNQHVKDLVKGKINALFVYSSAGLGKTTQIMRGLKKLKVDSIYLNGHTTPLAFLKKAYHNQDSLIVLDDIDEILRSKVIVGYLKGMLEEVEGARIVCNNSTSMKAQEIPERFEFKGKIILITNLKPHNFDESTYALISRCVVYLMEFSRKQRLSLITGVIKGYTNKSVSMLEKKRVYNYLRTRKNLTIEAINIRNYKKLLNIYLSLKRQGKVKLFKNMADSIYL